MISKIGKIEEVEEVGNGKLRLPSAVEKCRS